ncbi:MAG TPA: hypothetical protein VEC38_15580 [Candidatus Binataceae bacterium]|nr:hypothetical protein [Candidatus Binataceae bacterium]
MAAGAALTLIVCALSYYCDPVRRSRSEVPPDGRRELVQANSLERWWAFGALSKSDFHFSKSKTGAPEIEIRNDGFSTVGLRYTAGLFYPGWYELTGEFRVEGAEPGAATAELTVATSHWMSGHVPETVITAEWKKIDLYFRPSPFDSEAVVTCQLGGAGRAYFRDVHLANIGGAPPANAPQTDLEKTPPSLSNQHEPSRGGNIWSVIITVLLAAALAGACWERLGEYSGLAGREEPGGRNQTTA